MTSKEQVRADYEAMLKSTADGPVSTKAWYQQSGSSIPYDIWLLCVHSLAEANDDSWPYEMDVKLEPHGPMDGNVVMEDIVLSARALISS
jgi:hypothetical protein